MGFSDYISVIALVISAIALFISWRQYTRDQGNLKLSLDIQDDVAKGPLYVIGAVNEGHRPITILHAYALVSSGNRYPVFDTRTTLDATETIQFTVRFCDFFKSISSGYYIKAFEFEDTTGKRHMIRTNRLRRQVANILRKRHIT